jgi:CelD/BcsL family acetyltransferase involved in cellulose biosynthesis
MSVEEINCLAALSQYRQAWQQLLRSTPRATFFQTLEWLEIYWRHYAADQKLRVLVMASEGQIEGILPLVVRKETTRAGSLRFLTYPLDSWGSHYGPIGPQPEAILRAGLDHLRRTPRDFDVLELRFVAEGSAAAMTESAHADCGIPAQCSEMVATAVTDLNGTWEQYLAGRTSKWRNNFRRWERRLHQRGRLEHVRYRPVGAAQGDADPRWDLYDACESLARRSWQTIDNQSSGTTLSSESIRAFLRDVHESAAALGCVDLNLLVLDGEPVAFTYNYYYAGRLYSLRIGYDASLARDGAGNLLYAYIIKDSFERGDLEYDFGPGSLECKQYLCSRMEPRFRFSYYPTTAWRAQLVRLKRRLAAPQIA